MFYPEKVSMIKHLATASDIALTKYSSLSSSMEPSFERTNDVNWLTTLNLASTNLRTREWAAVATVAGRERQGF